jgi:hypothetical protein
MHEAIVIELLFAAAVTALGMAFQPSRRKMGDEGCAELDRRRCSAHLSCALVLLGNDRGAGQHRRCRRSATAHCCFERLCGGGSICLSAVFRISGTSPKLEEDEGRAVTRQLPIALLMVLQVENVEYQIK